MVSIKKKTRNGKNYYYLGHTYRDKGRIKYKETYIGTELPDNIGKIKNDFLRGLYDEKWFSLFKTIKQGYLKELHGIPKEVLRENIEAFMVEFTYNTNRIEGSRLSFKDTAMLLKLGLTPKNKPLDDIKETETHKKVFYEMFDYKKELTLSLILKWHEQLFEETKLGIAGKLRNYQIYITGTKFIPPGPADVNAKMKNLIKWYATSKKTLNPVELAALLHIKFETIHPFGDGNGRIGRLIMNFVLHKNNYPMLNIPYAGRAGYYNALERAQVKDNEYVFALWFFKKYSNEYKRYMKSGK